MMRLLYSTHVIDTTGSKKSNTASLLDYIPVESVCLNLCEEKFATCPGFNRTQLSHGWVAWFYDYMSNTKHEQIT